MWFLLPHLHLVTLNTNQPQCNNLLVTIFMQFVNKIKWHWPKLYIQHIPTITRRNLGIFNHSICNYIRLCVGCDYFCNYLPTSSNLGKIRLTCDHYLLHPLMWMLLKLYSFVNKPLWPINCICNQILVTNWCTMCIMSMITIHIWSCMVKKFTWTIKNIY